MNTFKKLSLSNEDFNIDFDLVKIENTELIMFLSGYSSQNKNPGSFENQLGIRNGKSERSVYNIINNKVEDLNLEFIDSSEIIDFKYIKTELTYIDDDFVDVIDFDKYDLVYANEFIK